MMSNLPTTTKPPSTRQIAREAQILQVFGLLQSGECDTIKQACEQVGIETRTYERWVHRSQVLRNIDAQLREQVEAVRSMLADAYPKAVAELVARVLNPAAGNQSWIKVWKEFKALHSDITDHEAGAEDEAEAYLNGGHSWLSGPKTITVTFDDGTSVKVEKAGPTVIENTPVNSE